MRNRVRQILTLIFLLLFSLENLAAVIVPADAGKIISGCKIEVEKEKLGVTSFLFEGNEETDDDKVHGLAILLPANYPYSSVHFFSKINRDFRRSFDSRQRQQVLQLICRLSI